MRALEAPLTRTSLCVHGSLQTGFSPLFEAVQKGHLRVVNALQEHGAVVSLADKVGQAGGCERCLHEEGSNLGLRVEGKVQFPLPQCHKSLWFAG